MAMFGNASAFNRPMRGMLQCGNYSGVRSVQFVQLDITGWSLRLDMRGMFYNNSVRPRYLCVGIALYCQIENAFRASGFRLRQVSYLRFLWMMAIPKMVHNVSFCHLGLVLYATQNNRDDDDNDNRDDDDNDNRDGDDIDDRNGIDYRIE